MKTTKTIQNLSSKVALVILDGFGCNPEDFKNAIKAAQKQNLDHLFSHYPFTKITAGGEEVGLPKGVAGNSEVGHLNLGAGRPVRQDIVRINEAIKNSALEEMAELQNLISYSQKKTKRIHLMGLLSDGGVHSHIDHLRALMKIFNKYPDLEIYLHAFTDGRDTSKNRGLHFIQEVQEIHQLQIATLGGRSFGMDRDRRWDKIERAYHAMTTHSYLTTLSPENYIQDQYSQNIYDEYLPPVLFNEKGIIENGDCILFFNFRPDRAKQLTLALNDPAFDEFPINIKPGFFLCFTPYVQDELPNLPILFNREKVSNTLSEYLSNCHLKQFKIAETEKYAHVTYFFNGGETKPFEGEDRKLIPSPRDVATYDLKPEMSAHEVTKNLLTALDDDKYSFYLTNYANADMVGHTGNYSAAIKAIETLDQCLAQVSKKCLEKKITLIITADHGNADQMSYEDGSSHTSHTNALVPFCIIHPELEDETLQKNHKKSIYSLQDVAPTILRIFNLSQPPCFKGESIWD